MRNRREQSTIERLLLRDQIKLIFGERAMIPHNTEPHLTLDAVRIQHALEFRLLHQGQLGRRADPDIGHFFGLRAAIPHPFLSPTENPPRRSCSPAAVLLCILGLLIHTPEIRKQRLFCTINRGFSISDGRRPAAGRCFPRRSVWFQPQTIDLILLPLLITAIGQKISAKGLCNALRCSTNIKCC